MTNVYPKNLWLDQGLRGCHVSEGKRAGLSGWKQQEMEGGEERRGGGGTANECQAAQAGRQSGRVGGLWQTRLTQADSSVNSPRMAALIDS